MKKTDNKNPLKFFNDNKEMAYKKAGGAMKNFKKSLPKAQYGPITENQSKIQELLNSQPPIPQAPKSSGYDNVKIINDLKSSYNVDRRLPFTDKAMMDNPFWRMTHMYPTPNNKKGGAVKIKKKK